MNSVPVRFLGGLVQVDDGEGGHEVRRVGPLGRVHRRVVNNLLLLKCMRSKKSNISSMKSSRNIFRYCGIFQYQISANKSTYKVQT